MKFNLRNIIAIFIGILIAYFSFSILIESQKRREIAIDNAEIKNIKYGLLSVHAWKRQVSEILSKKINEFELTGKNNKEIRKQIEKALYKLLDDIDVILDEKKQEGGFFKQSVNSLIINPIASNYLQSIRKKVPTLTTNILKKLNNKKTREKLKEFIQQKLDSYLDETVGKEDLSKIEFLVSKYETENMQECSNLLQAKLNNIDEKLQIKSLIIVVLFIVVFFILLYNKDIQNIDFFILLSISAILLITGISTPMIDIDARIQNFDFKFMGETIAFQDQILFYQSKSIFDVVKILVQTGQFQSIIVGMLIFLFSIIFPFSKLIASFSILLKNNLYNNTIVRFFALKSSKWAMADVIVVAIFMSYIGFSGVIDSQLKQLETAKENVQIFTTDNSNFGVGFFIFLCFAVGGLFLASKLEKQVQKKME